MLRSSHYELLDQLRYGESSVERKEALKDLIVFEQEGKFEDDDFLSLLKEKDKVFQIYAIGALGRQQVEKSIPLLTTLYKESNDPLILLALLDAFLLFESDAFVDVVLSRIKIPDKKKKAKKKNRSTMIFDNGFILDQVIIPSLKYLQISGGSDIKDTILPYLDHDDSNVRWHSMVVFDKLEIPLDEKKLEEIKQADKSILVREQAEIMLIKRNM